MVDTLREGDETLTVRISATRGVISTQHVAEVTIYDNYDYLSLKTGEGTTAPIRIDTRRDLGGLLANGTISLSEAEGPVTFEGRADPLTFPYDTTQLENNWYRLVQGTNVSDWAILNTNTVMIEYGRLSTNTVWTSNAVHLVRNWIVVPSGITLSVTAGAVVKFTQNTGIVVEDGGRLVVTGTSDADVIFTHVADDTIGGDTDMVNAVPSTDAYEIYTFPSGTFSENGWFQMRHVSQIAGYASLVVNGASTEETSGTIYLPVTLSMSRNVAFSIDWKASDGTAKFGTDYTLASGRLSWSNTSEGTKYIAIPILADSTIRDPRTFTVELTAVRGMICTQAVATARIYDSPIKPAASTHLEWAETVAAPDIALNAFTNTFIYQIAAESQPLTYSALWQRPDTASNTHARLTALHDSASTATVLLDGHTNGEGIYTWTTREADEGWYTLTHETLDANNHILDVFSTRMLVLRSPIFHAGTLTTNETWSSDRVQLITGTVYVPVGVHLMIEPGTIVKFCDDTALNVEMINDPVNATGVIFTHYADDDVGGDTNGDNDQTRPSINRYALIGNIITDETTQMRYLMRETAGTLTSDVMWQPGMTYHITGNLTVPRGKSLRIPQGTIVKIAANVSLSVSSGGNLEVAGTVERPVMFTSLYDDAIRGDSNGDGVSRATNGDWGGIHMDGGTGTFSHCEFRYGGGVSVSGVRANVMMLNNAVGTFESCLFSHAYQDGCFAQNARFDNCLFVDNVRGLVAAAGNVMAVNSIFYKNGTGYYGIGGTLSIRNSIAALNTSMAYGSDAGELSAEYTCFYNPDVTNGNASAIGIGNIEADPLFKDADGNDFRLIESSPCVDAGSNDEVLTETDYLDHARIENGTVDMGICEGAVETMILIFDAQGGSVYPTQKRYYPEETFGILPVPTRTGYAFCGWWTEADGDGTMISATNVVARLAQQTVYATWTAETYTVTFDPQGGTIDPSTKTVTYDAAYGDLPIPTHPEGNLFAGWWTTIDARGTQILEETALTTAADISLYAHWMTVNSAAGTTGLVWTVGGTLPWFIQNRTAHDGAWALQSGAITNQQETWIETTVTGEGTLSFWWKSSCEDDPDFNDWDYVRVAVDGYEQARIDGETDWTHTALTIASGTHTIRWIYKKDRWFAGGQDCAWLDGVSWTPAVQATQTTPIPVPYAWLNTYHLATDNNYEHAALMDTDSDGYTAWEEYVTGTCPTNNTSRLFTQIAFSNGIPSITWTPDMGHARMYTIEAKSSLTDTEWVSPTNASSRFFRVKVKLPD